MKKYILAIGLVVVFAAYAIYQFFGGSKDVSGVTSTTGSTTDTTSTGTQTSGLKDGVYTSKVADAYYGPMQVKATIAGGKLTDIEYVQYPNDRGHTSEVSAASLPKLKAEAIQIQSANVNTISGATQTVDGFKVALADALAQAKN